GAADLGGALDELGHLLRLDPVGGDVVEQEERLGPGRQDVVDAVGCKVGATVAQTAALAREHELRADAVGRGSEQALLAERVASAQIKSSPWSCGRPCGPPGRKRTVVSPRTTLVRSRSTSRTSASASALRSGSSASRCSSARRSSSAPPSNSSSHSRGGCSS